MRCCSSSSASKDRCVFTSVLLLGALFAMQASPCSRGSLVPLFVLLGIPAMTFAVAAPTRVGISRELGLFLRGLESFLLGGLLLALGRGRDAKAVRQRHRARVERVYLASDERFAELVEDDPLRLHHVRRLAFFTTTVIVLAGLGLPLLEPSTYTFGAFPEAPFVVLLDLVAFALAGRVVTERVALRLFEITSGPRASGPVLGRLGMVPVSSLLGVALGAVGGLVVVGVAALACAIETSWLASGVPMSLSARWFIHQTAPDAMMLGIALGAIFGMGVGLAQKPWREPAEVPAEVPVER